MIEDEIAEAEKQLAALSEELARPETARDPRRAAALDADYRHADEPLRALYTEWESLTEAQA